MRSLDAIGFAQLAWVVLVASCGNKQHAYADVFADAGAPPPTDAASGPDSNLVSDSAGPCTNLQCQQVVCASNLPDTTVSGFVLDPAGKNPLYDVIVYVPNAPVQPFSPDVACDQCGSLPSGSPLVAALTGPDGKFVLSHVPTGGNIPVVLQLGKWRKQVTVPYVTACQDTLMDDPMLMRLPAKQSEGDMPMIAVATGGCDPFECLLRKIGIDDSEFTDQGGTGRVQVFKGAGGASISASTVPAAQLWASQALTDFDLVINACECSEEPTEKPQSSIDNLVSYANAGGRLFNTHYHYYWIDPTKITSQPPVATNPAWQSTALFIPEQDGTSSIDGFVDQTFPKGDAFAQWLVNVSASTNIGIFPIDQARYNAQTVYPPSTLWVNNPNTGETDTTGNALLHYTFNTPVGLPPNFQCGKVLYSDFHVVSTAEGGDGGTSSGATFPAECDTQPMSPQELALEFMLFDLSACIQEDSQAPQPPPTQ
jgi:hypothetical protein